MQEPIQNIPIEARIIRLREGILKKNDLLARDLRAQFAAQGTFVVNIVSSPGSGKTEFLKETLKRLAAKTEYRIAALVGDLATDNDAKRLAESGVPVRQITTGTMCHLEAEMIQNALENWGIGKVDVLFIENVGNLVCPSSYDLGENMRLVALSVTEGEDKPLKYPTIFNSADVAIVTKIDIAQAVEFNRETALHNLLELRPTMRIFEVSAKTGAGMEGWIDFLLSSIEANKVHSLVGSIARESVDADAALV